MAEKILVVDDNVHLIQGVQYYLEEEGYQVITASNGREALRLFNSERPDLLLLDEMMPELDGWQVCQRLRETSDVPIIMLTAKTEKTSSRGLTWVLTTISSSPSTRGS